MHNVLKWTGAVCTAVVTVLVGSVMACAAAVYATARGFWLAGKRLWATGRKPPAVVCRRPRKGRPSLPEATRPRLGQPLDVC